MGEERPSTVARSSSSSSSLSSSSSQQRQDSPASKDSDGATPSRNNDDGPQENSPQQEPHQERRLSKRKGDEEAPDGEETVLPLTSLTRARSRVGAIAVGGIGASSPSSPSQTSTSLSTQTSSIHASDTEYTATATLPPTTLDREVSVEATLVTDDDYEAELHRVILRTSVKASKVEPHQEGRNNTASCRFWALCALGTFLILSTITVSIFLGVYSPADRDDSSGDNDGNPLDAGGGPLNPQPTSPTQRPPLSETTLIAFLKDRSFDGGASLREYTSAQRTALRFIAAEFPEAYLDEHLIDIYAVATLFFSTSGTFWTNNTSWKSGESVCMWHGIQCDEQGYIIAIEKPNNNMGGVLPPEIGLLAPRQVDKTEEAEPIPLRNTTGLQRLNLSQNSIGGTIPPQVGLLSAMQVFLVHDNALTGLIPDEISTWTDVREASFQGNPELSGMVPDTLCHKNNNNTDDQTKRIAIAVDCTTIYCSCCCET